MPECVYAQKCPHLTSECIYTQCGHTWWKSAQSIHPLMPECTYTHSTQTCHQSAHIHKVPRHDNRVHMYIKYQTWHQSAHVHKVLRHYTRVHMYTKYQDTTLQCTYTQSIQTWCAHAHKYQIFTPQCTMYTKWAKFDTRVHIYTKYPDLKPECTCTQVSRLDARLHIYTKWS